MARRGGPAKKYFFAPGPGQGTLFGPIFGPYLGPYLGPIWFPYLGASFRSTFGPLFRPTFGPSLRPTFGPGPMVGPIFRPIFGPYLGLYLDPNLSPKLDPYLDPNWIHICCKIGPILWSIICPISWPNFGPFWGPRAKKQKRKKLFQSWPCDFHDQLNGITSH